QVEVGIGVVGQAGDVGGVTLRIRQIEVAGGAGEGDVLVERRVELQRAAGGDGRRPRAGDGRAKFELAAVGFQRAGVGHRAVDLHAPRARRLDQAGIGDGVRARVDGQTIGACGVDRARAAVAELQFAYPG